MSKIDRVVQWIGLVALIFSVIGNFVIFGYFDSERSKRIELEAELAGHICKPDTVFIGLGDNKIYFSPIDSAGQWLSPASLLAVPTQQNKRGLSPP